MISVPSSEACSIFLLFKIHPGNFDVEVRRCRSSLFDVEGGSAIREQQRWAATLRRLRFFIHGSELPTMMAPLLAVDLWSSPEAGNLIFGFPGIAEESLRRAAEMLQTGCEAVVTRSDVGQAVLLALARNRRNDLLVMHWANLVDQFSTDSNEQPDFQAGIGADLTYFLCDSVCSLRVPAQSRSIGNSALVPERAKTGSELVKAAVRKLMPFNPALLDDPEQNSLTALNAPAASVKQNAGCLITEFMAFVRLQRSDLEAAFDLKNVEGQRHFAEWFLDRGLIEYGISPEYLEPVRAVHSPELAVEIASVVEQSLVVNSTHGVNLIGYPRAEMGMGEQLRSCAEALKIAEIPLSIVDFHAGIIASQADRRYEEYIRTDNPFPVNIFHINADQIALTRKELGADFFRNHYNIGYWEWELPTFPDEWLSAVDQMDEIWAPSRFIQRALSEKTSKPVIWMPLAVECETPSVNPAETRAEFGLPEDAFLFLFSFDFSSFVTRKNFRAVLEALRRAFPHDSRMGLVLKTIRHARHTRPFWELLREIADDDRIFLIDRVLRRNQVRALTACCDSFLSLHRSEGFGLGIAEAMYLGKPVIATNYSGNTDFTLPDNSCPVNYRLVPVNEGEYLFPEGQVWAEADVDHAASHMQRLFVDREYAAKIGRAGAAFIRKQHSYKAVGRRYARRLKQIEAARALLHPKANGDGVLQNVVNRLRLPRNSQ